MKKTKVKSKTVLLRAAKLIEEKGWCKRKFTSHGRYCVLGAINKVTNDDAYVGNEDAFKAKAALINFGFINCVPTWNDQQESRKDVVAKLREVAKKLP